jgi:hypothetical protein
MTVRIPIRAVMEKQDDPTMQASTEQEFRVPGHGTGNAVRWLPGVAALAVLIIGCVMRGVEPWMRPQLFWRTAEWVWPLMAGVGALGFTAFMISLDSGRHRLRQAMIALVVSFSLAGAMRWVGGELAISRLVDSPELSGNPYYTSTGSRSISQKLVSWMKDNATEHPETTDLPRMHRLVSSSRWPVRREFLKRMTRDEKLAGHLVEKWNELFPAVTGADVDLHHRRELMTILDGFRNDTSLTKASRHAAILWMGLVLLSDPDEFAMWREPVRDAMLGTPEPFQAKHHDCWMRVVDTLLAHDPPASWPAATEGLTSNPTTLRRAVRERVRGIMSHFDAIEREFDASSGAADWDAAFALWQDTGRWLAAYPGTHEEARVKQWRSATMFQWLNTDGLGTLWKDLDHNFEILLNLTSEDVVDLTPQQEAVLHAKACHWADQATALSEKAATESEREEAHSAMERVRVLHPFLTNIHQKEIVRKVTPTLVRPDIYSKHGEYGSCDRCSSWMKQSWRQLSSEDLNTLAKNMRPILSPRRGNAWLLCIEAWSDRPELGDEEWLLRAIAEGPFWKSTNPDTPRDLIEIVPYTRLPVPPVKDEVVCKAIAIIKAAMWDAGGQILPAADVSSNLASMVPEYQLSSATRKALHYSVSRIRAEFRLRDFKDFESAMRMDLYLSGLTAADESLLSEIARRARDDGRFHDRLCHWHPNPWRDVLKSPSEARQYLLSLISKDDSRLRGLLSSAVKNPPPDDVVLAMWQVLRKLATTADSVDKPRVHASLFRLAPLVPVAERLAMRSDFLEYFRATPLPSNKWPDFAMVDVWQWRSHYGAGEAVPWEEDSLSAALSWSSDIYEQTDLTPENGVAEQSRGVFSYLAQAKVSYSYEVFTGTWMNQDPINEPVSKSVWKRSPLKTPLEPTPWQQARNLHLKRPDLKFPDHAWPRPGRSNP